MNPNGVPPSGLEHDPDGFTALGTADPARVTTSGSYPITAPNLGSAVASRSPVSSATGSYPATRLPPGAATTAGVAAPSASVRTRTAASAPRRIVVAMVVLRGR